jgi:hypothetical protein
LLCRVQVGLLVAGECGAPINSAVTYLSYLHISLQPWMYNEWQWAMKELRERGDKAKSESAAGVAQMGRSDEHKRLVRVLSAFWCVGTLLRLVPCIPGAGTGECYYCAQREHFCAFDGSAACTYMGSLHIVRRSQKSPRLCQGPPTTKLCSLRNVPCRIAVLAATPSAHQLPATRDVGTFCPVLPSDGN